MARKPTLRLSILCLALSVMLVPSASAQAVYGNIIGTVSDPQGAAVPNAKITATSVGKGTTFNTTSNESGNYTLTHLIPDAYRVRVEAPGFKATESQVQVFADSSPRLDLQFQVGQTAETVTVTAEAEQLKTDRADVATTFTDRALVELPILSRNFTEYQLLTPGTQTLTWQHAASENTQRSTQIFVNGQHFSGSSYQLDGTENRDPILGIIVINPILDSVTEAKIATQNYDAEFGQALAAVITAQTKSGSNEIHGSTYWFRRNDEWQARDPFTESRPNAITGKFKPDALWNQFGATVGGPIIKNKAFFFGGYQGTREKVGRSVAVTVPTQLVRDTCLNPGSPICNLSEYLSAGQIFDPATGDPADPSTRTAFAGNIIPNSRISQQARDLLSLLPAPNAGLGIRGNFNSGGTGGFNDDSFTGRGDYQFSDKIHFFGRYSFFESDLTGRAVFDTDQVAVGGRGLGFNGFGGVSDTRNQNLSTGFDYVFSPNWLTDFRFGWFKYRVIVSPNGVGTSPAADLNIPGLNLDPFFTSGMPAFFIGDQGQDGGDMELGYALSDRLTRCNCPLQEVEDQFQFVNNWTRVFGNHNVKFGGDIRYARNLRIPSDRHRAGELSFNKTRTGDASPGTGLPLATFLLGDVTRFTRYPPPSATSPTDAGERQKRWFFYGQDTFRATPKLTINVGLRWEIYFPERVTGEARGGFLDLETGQVRVAGVGGIDENFNVENSWKNFAPRLGIAYQATPNTVVRMGYGRSFDIGVFGSIFGHVVTQNLPVLAIQEDIAPNAEASVFNLTAGPAAPPVIAVPADGLITLPDTIFQRARPNRMQLPTVDAWNLTIQHQVTRTLSAEIGYVGNKGTHVFAGDGPAFNGNQASLVGFPTVPRNLRLPFFLRYPFQTANAAGDCTAFANAGPDGIRQTPVGGAIAGDDIGFCWKQGIDELTNRSSNNYHGLQAKVEQRFSKGFQLLAHYTWAQAFNFDGEYFPIDPRVNYGPNNFNRRHVFVLTQLWELPIGRGKAFAGDASGVLDHIIGGWQLNTITNWSGGMPFSPGLSGCGGISDTGPCRPNIMVPVGDIEYGDRNGWIPTCSNATCSGANEPWALPSVGTFGSANRNSLRGPQFFQTDMSIFKNFTVSERVRAQFRAEFTNVFNHVNLGTPNVFWSQFGFGGSNCINCGNPVAITSTGGPMRQFQVGARLTF